MWVASFLLCITTGVLAMPPPANGNRCPNGFRYINDDTNAVMYDDRDVRTCDFAGSSSCIKIQYTYRTSEVNVKAEWDMPCYNPRKLPSFDLNTLFPQAAVPMDISMNVCIPGNHGIPGHDGQCVDITPPAKTDLYCNRGVVVVDTDKYVTLINDVTKEQCNEHQTGCYTMTQHFTYEGQSAMRMVGGCYDEWRSYNFIWDRFYPYTDFSGGFCEKHGCITFKVWHKDSFDTRACYCDKGNTIGGTYGSPVVENCSGNMCNSMLY